MRTRSPRRPKATRRSALASPTRRHAMAANMVAHTMRSPGASAAEHGHAQLASASRGAEPTQINPHTAPACGRCEDMRSNSLCLPRERAPDTMPRERLVVCDAEHPLPGVSCKTAVAQPSHGLPVVDRQRRECGVLLVRMAGRKCRAHPAGPRRERRHQRGVGR